MQGNENKKIALNDKTILICEMCIKLIWNQTNTDGLDKGIGF